MAGTNGKDTQGLLQSIASGSQSPSAWLHDWVLKSKHQLGSEEFASSLDAHFAAHPSYQRDSFLIPAAGNFEKVHKSLVDCSQEAIYLCGHSLGLQPKRTRTLVNEELDKWAQVGVEGHFTGERPWAPIDEFVVSKSASIVGALPSEVAIMNGLTSNLHLLMVALYKPEKGQRFQIMYESDAFPSDYHAFESQAQFHGLDTKDALVPLTPRTGEDLLRTEDFIAAIEKAGRLLGVVVLETVNYYTGQYFDVPAIVEAAHKVGAVVLCQLAHAAGNVNLKLHDWRVDGAVWCSYKYLNSGPGGIAGFFIHEMHHSKISSMPKFTGWWGHQKETRFDMRHVFHPMPGAAAFQLSNPPVLQTVSLLASLDVFLKSTMTEIRGRSMLLTAYLELLVQMRLKEGNVGIKIITPQDPMKRGACFSFKFDDTATCVTIFEEVQKRGVVIDYRKPDVLRVAPAPLYNNFTDIFRFCKCLTDGVQAVKAGSPTKKARTS